MEGKIVRMILFLLIISSLQVSAGYRSVVYNAYISNKMSQWKDVIDEMDAITEKSDELLLELVNYQYGYIGYCIGFDRKEEAKKYLTRAQKNLSILEKHRYNLPVIYSYKAAFYGFRIGLNPVTAPVNGLKSIDSAREAGKLDPDNYLVYIQLGNIESHLPSAFGGSKKEALEYYLKAKSFLERDPGSLVENWNYMNLLILIGQTYTDLKDHTSAMEVYEKILTLEPGFIYVRDDLYPKLLEKMKN